ncbi:protein kinase domain-containing protein [Haematococcus lacustris]|uniref:Protein kinase domain-containing protein n=1 Tax=Haematococcus lacustris TaxID=44745 RepID=A0A699ZHM8_HAELA|nr:protein kinase domain-containing protein [Haematococcus lacustris]
MQSPHREIVVASVEEHKTAWGASGAGGWGQKQAQEQDLASLQMPDAMDYAVDLVTRPCVAVDDALMQACSYCQEKKWRFTFITYYQLTFFVWRVAEDKYAVTDGFLHDGAPYGLHTREALAYIMWMSLEAPWGKQLSEQDNGALQALEKQLKQQVAVKVLRGKPMEDNKDPSELSKLQHSRSLASGGERRNQTTGTAYYAAHQKDQPPSWTPIRDAPEYPLAALQLGGKNLGAGQCGPVMQGWFGEVPVAIKGTDACKRPDIVKMLWHEAQIYGTLKELQGHILPVLHGCGYWWGRNSFFLATSVVAGEPLNYCIDEAVSEAVAEAARQALTAIHQRGVAHGDVRYDNFLVQYHDDKAQVYIIGFGHAYLNPTPEECEDEMAELERVLLNGLGVPE